MSYPVTFESEHPRITRAVQALIAINVVVWFVQATVYGELSSWLGFEYAAQPARWWTAISYMFAHAGLLHLAANMYGLYLFGPRLEHAWGPRKFVWFYTLCGLGGVAFDMLVVKTGTLIGSSAAVFGVMTAFAMQWPDDEVYLMFVMPMRARTLVIGLFMTNLVLGVIGTTDATNITYLSQIGGVIAAYVYMRMAASTGMDQVRQRVANIPEADEPPRAIPRNMPRRERGDEVDDIVAKSKAIAAKRVTTLTPTSRRREARADELNRVLDKISEQGISSLTGEERRLLEEMSKKLRDR
jgi:membrane associated rhomboid family serine protease